MKVDATWDSDAQVWTVTDSEVLGLVAEAATLEDLCSRLQNLVPELLAANGHTFAAVTLIELSARRSLTIS
jgi:hypothetical protein